MTPGFCSYSLQTIDVFYSRNKNCSQHNEHTFVRRHVFKIGTEFLRCVQSSSGQGHEDRGDWMNVCQFSIVSLFETGVDLKSL